MFKIGTFEALIIAINRLGAVYIHEKVEHAAPNQPKGTIPKFSYDNRVKLQITALLHHIQSTPSISKVFDNKQYNYGGISYTMLPESLLEWLVMQSQVLGANNVLNNLNYFLKLGYTPANQVLAMSGLTVQKKIIITNGISIVPIQECSASRMRIEASPKNVASPSPMGGTLVTDEKFAKVVVLKSIKLQTITGNQYDFPETKDTTLDEFCSFLTLLDQFSPMKFNSWFEIADWVPRHNIHLFSSTPAFFKGVVA